MLIHSIGRFMHTSTSIELRDLSRNGDQTGNQLHSQVYQTRLSRCYARSETSTPHEEQRQPLFTDFPRTTLGAPDFEPAG